MKFGLAPIIFVTLILQSCNFNASTSTISNVKICTRIENSSCSGNLSSLPSSSGKIFTTAQINNVPNGTQIAIIWEYNNGGEWYKIDIIELTYSNNNPIISSLNAPKNGWPKGNYRITYTLDIDGTKPIITRFNIGL